MLFLSMLNAMRPLPIIEGIWGTGGRGAALTAALVSVIMRFRLAAANAVVYIQLRIINHGQLCVFREPLG